MMVASTAASGGFGLETTPETASSYYLLTAEARQRLTSGQMSDVNDVSRPYDAALLQNGSWSFTGFNNTYMSHLPAYLQSSRQSIMSDVPDNRTICPRIPTIEASAVGSGRDNTYEIYRDRLYDEEHSPTLPSKIYRPPDIVFGSSSSPRLSPNYADGNDGIDQRTPRTSPSIEATVSPISQTNSQKKAKKPFTIENIIAPDDDKGKGVESRSRDTALLIPRPLYAGYSMTASRQYETAT